jgi:hypothetical protein
VEVEKPIVVTGGVYDRAGQFSDRRAKVEDMRMILGTAAAVVLTLSNVSSATSADQSAAAAGLSWKRVDLPHSHQSLRGLDAVNAKVAWVSGDEGGVWRTTDGGKTWKDVRPDAEKALAFRDVEADSGDVAQVLSIGPRGQSRIYKTIDGGKSCCAKYQV